MILHPPAVSTSQLMWDKTTCRFVGEISDFGKSFRFGQVYEAAADEGLTLVSSKFPGQEMVFVVSHTEVRDGDVIWWDLQPASRAEREHVDFTVRIYND